MSRPLTQTQQDIIATMLEDSNTPQAMIADAAKCSIESVKRVKKNIKNWGTIRAPKLGLQGRPRIMTQSDIDVCFDLLISVFI
jgi:DNA invertase Pin-like site-specific DNA recombinase